MRFVRVRAIFCNMARPKPDSADVQAAAPSVPERLLLFCAASGTDWESAGITGAIVTAAVSKGLIGGEPTGGLYLTKERRAALRTRMGEHL
jgi:hypothetical protein